MPLLTRFDTPAALRDFPLGSAFYDRWSEKVDELMGRDRFPGSAGPEPAPIGTPVGEFSTLIVTMLIRSPSARWFGWGFRGSC